ncbi:MAG: DUF5069 domain-containing protein [Candidatus Poribacteria bacterium]|nr:DUF5069 domain-containing protein [Candidatus Poribacteria bacterium]
MGLDWKPRGRDLVVGNIPWLARAADKARAKIHGQLGDYIYPCPADKGFLERNKISEPEFSQLVKENPSDEQVIAAFRKVIEKNKG